MRPQPLQPHTTSRDMVAAGEQEESLMEFLKDSDAIALLQQQQGAVVAAQKAAAEISERLKPSDTPILSSLRRKISSTFVKDAPEQPKRVDQDSLSPSHSKGAFFRKTSNTKSTARGDNLQSISENDLDSAPASDMGNRSSRGREEQPVLGKTDDSSHATKEHTNPTSVPKAPTHRPLLVVDTAQATRNIAAPANDSTAPKSLSSKDKKTSKQSSPSVVNSKQSSPSVAEPSSKFSLRFTKPKSRKYKDSDPEVKELERIRLQEEFGVNSTAELFSAHRKPPPTPAAIAPSRQRTMSFAESAAVSYQNRLRSQSQPHSSYLTHTMQPFADPVHKREVSNNSVESTGSVVRSATGQHISFGSALSGTDTFDSRASTFPSSALRESGGTSHSVTAPSTPETSNPGATHHFRRKEAGSGYSHEHSGSLSASPTSYLAGHPRTGQHSSSVFQSPVKQGTGRSFTDPYDGQASIGSIVRATRAAFLDLYDQSITDSATHPFEQHTMSSHEGSSADSNANQIPRPLRPSRGGSLEGPSGKTNTSASTGSYELDAPHSRIHGSNEFMAHPNALPGTMLPSSFTGDPAERRNQPHSGLHEQRTNSIYTSSTQANSPASAISGSISGPSDDTAVGTLPAPLVSGNGSSRTNLPGRPATVLSPSHPLSTTVVRDFQNLQTAGVPSNRFQLEENAEADRRRKRMTKQHYVAYRVGPAPRNDPTAEADLS